MRSSHEACKVSNNELANGVAAASHWIELTTDSSDLPVCFAGESLSAYRALVQSYSWLLSLLWQISAIPESTLNTNILF